MEKSKVISVRLSESLIRKIDEVVAKNVYWRRNAVISQFLEICIKGMDDDTKKEALRWWSHSWNKIKVTIDFDAK